MMERTFIEQGMKKIQLEQYVKGQLDKAGFTGLDIVKTPLVTRIVLTVARPGLAIGRGGQNIRQLTEEIGKKFDIDNPQIEIRDIKQPELDAKATVDRMVGLLERGYSWRSVAFRTVRNVMAAGAQGVELLMKGKLSGKGGRKRKQRIAEGYMKKVGNQVKLVDYAKASAYPKAGAVGIKLRIIGPEVVFPDKVRIEEFIEKREAAAAATEKEEKLAEEKKEEEKKEKEKKPGEEKEKEKPAEKKEKGEKKGKHAGEKKEKPGEKKGKKAGEKREKAEHKKHERKAVIRAEAAEKNEKGEKKETKKEKVEKKETKKEKVEKK